MTAGTGLLAEGPTVVPEQIWWYVARSGGIVALLLAGLSVVWGLLLSTRVTGGRPTPKWLTSLHRHLGTLTVTFTSVHVAALVADDYVDFGWSDVLVPLASDWKPVPVAFGVIAFHLLIAVQISSLLMKRLPRRYWKLIHLSSFGLLWAGLVHGATAGSDATNPLYTVAMAVLVCATLFLTLFRVLAGRRRRRPDVASSIRDRAVTRAADRVNTVVS
ncbi:MAG: ferric reductase-like transmembrane domain-containing protein [Acidimicrobiia bacterium]|nr:ferric reductase-like transmembrane domain-containing protein [Acidimicrobiia bacterium]